MKRIPYGIDDFERIILDDYYYIDKSMYIKKFEDHSSYVLFVRPRRMGKSLFTNMMMSYYDLGKKDMFEQLFGHLWIGKNPTKEANRYLVLKFDFSKVKTDLSSLNDNFNLYCFGCLINFFDQYSNIFTPEERNSILSLKFIKEAINRLTNLIKAKGLPSYLFIDEYDNFCNQILAARGVKAHEEITHGEGFYRDFFKSFKGSFTRVFLSGVTPVTYDDLTSGFNIADVLSLHRGFNSAIGVTEAELREMIEHYRAEGKIQRPTQQIITEMKPWYDNFCFSEECFGTEPPIYNTDMVMRYMKELVLTGFPPSEMLDHNARTDYQKLNYLVIAEDIENREQRIETVRKICASGYTAGHVHEQFRASDCGCEENFKSMLFYYGTLTFGGWDERGIPKLQVPNRTMGELYLSYMLKLAEAQGYPLRRETEELDSFIYRAAAYGEWEPMAQKLGECYAKYSSLRNSIRGEADMQGFLRGLLCLNPYYAIWPELELGAGYGDILLVPKGTPRCPTRYSYLIELKYMKVSENDPSPKVTEACEQLDRYSADKKLQESALLLDTPLTKLYLVFQGNALIAQGKRD